MSATHLKKLLIHIAQKVENKLETWKQNGSIPDSDYKEMKEEFDRFLCESGLQRFCVQCGKRILISHHNQTYCHECSTNAERTKRCRRNAL